MKMYKLLSSTGEFYESSSPGLLGGNKKEKIYGRLDCPSANRYLARGYEKIRVFFASKEDAINAGYRPCGICMKSEYIVWAKSNVEMQTRNFTNTIKEKELGRTLTKDEYKKAFSINSLSVNQIKILNGWIEYGKSNWVTPEILKTYMGYEEVGRINIDVGSIGKKIIDSLNLDIKLYNSDDGKQTAYWSVYCDEYDNEKGWHLSNDFFMAMIELKILNNI